MKKRREPEKETEGRKEGKKSRKERQEEKKEKEEMEGEIRIINSKVKEGLCYNIKIIKNKKLIYNEDNKEGIKEITKDILLDELLIKIYKKFKEDDENFKLTIKINYKEYVKKFNILLSKYADYMKRTEKYDPKTNDIGIVKLHKEFTEKIKLLELKNNIKLID